MLFFLLLNQQNSRYSGRSRILYLFIIFFFWDIVYFSNFENFYKSRNLSSEITISVKSFRMLTDIEYVTGFLSFTCSTNPALWNNLSLDITLHLQNVQKLSHLSVYLYLLTIWHCSISFSELHLFDSLSRYLFQERNSQYTEWFCPNIYTVRMFVNNHLSMALLCEIWRAFNTLKGF